MSVAGSRSGVRRFLFSGQGWPYLLVPFIPLAVALQALDASAALVFFSAALGVVPTAALMGRATEELAARAERFAELLVECVHRCVLRIA